MSDKLVELKNLNYTVNHLVSNVILPALIKDTSFTWNTKYTHFKTVNIVTTMLNNLNFRFCWIDENNLVISCE